MSGRSIPRVRQVSAHHEWSMSGNQRRYRSWPGRRWKIWCSEAQFPLMVIEVISGFQNQMFLTLHAVITLISLFSQTQTERVVTAAQTDPM
jgi:hypothetical protein